MHQYRITVETIDNPTDEPTITVIECQSRYLLREDLSEWVREEVDPDATVTNEPVMHDE